MNEKIFYFLPVSGSFCAKNTIIEKKFPLFILPAENPGPKQTFCANRKDEPSANALPLRSGNPRRPAVYGAALFMRCL